MPKVRQILESQGISHALSQEQVLDQTNYAEPVFKLLARRGGFNGCFRL